MCRTIVINAHPPLYSYPVVLFAPFSFVPVSLPTSQLKKKKISPDKEKETMTRDWMIRLHVVNSKNEKKKFEIILVTTCSLIPTRGRSYKHEALSLYNQGEFFSLLCSACDFIFTPWVLALDNNLVMFSFNLVISVSDESSICIIFLRRKKNSAGV